MPYCTSKDSRPPDISLGRKSPDLYNASMTDAQAQSLTTMRKKDAARAKRNNKLIASRRLRCTERQDRLSMLASLGVVRALGLDDVNDPSGVSMDGFQRKYKELGLTRVAA